MGNDPVKSNRPTFQWEIVENVNGIQIYKRLDDGKLAEKRTIYLDSSHSFQTEQSIYNYRKTNDQGLVRVYQVNFLSENSSKKKQAFSDMCKCTQSMNIVVFSERIEYRLSELPQLTFAQSLQFLKQTLYSFQIVYHKMGPLHINTELIGVNELGEIRVWVNQNWALNHPSHLIRSLKSTKATDQEYNTVPPELRDESEMIKNLVSVIESKTEQGRFPSDLGEQLRQKTTSFRETRKFMNRFATEEFKSYIPNIIKRNGAVIPKTQSKLSQNSTPILTSQIPSREFSGVMNTGYTSALINNKSNISTTYVPTTNNFTVRPINNDIGYRFTSTNSRQNVSSTPKPFDLKMNPPALNSNPINIKINTVPSNNVKVSAQPSYSSTLNLDDYKLSTKYTSNLNNLNNDFNFARQTQSTNFQPFKITKPLPFQTSYQPSTTKSYLDPLSSYTTSFNSSPLTFKQFQPKFTNYTTYNYETTPHYQQKVTYAPNQTSSLFPQIKFNLLGKYEENYSSNFNYFDINNKVVPEQVKSSIEMPTSPLQTLNFMLSKDFGQINQDPYKINTKIQNSTNQDRIVQQPINPLNTINQMLRKDLGQEHQATYAINPQIQRSSQSNTLGIDLNQLTTLQT